MSSKNTQLAMECKRHSESCLYTSTSMFIWLRFVRVLKTIFIVVPLILGSLATWKILTGIQANSVRVFTSVCAFLAGLLPAIYSALKFDDHLEECKHLAGEFKNLQDRFRQAALVWSRKSFSEFEKDVEPLMQRLEKARSSSFTPPEWCFQSARKKVQAGDYDFDVDIADLESKATGAYAGE